jgi:hypothetical protein
MAILVFGAMSFWRCRTAIKNLLKKTTPRTGKAGFHPPSERSAIAKLASQSAFAYSAPGSRTADPFS